MSLSLTSALVTTDVKLPWRSQALCRVVTDEALIMGDAWINEDSYLIEFARKICDECPVRLLCVQDALSDPQSEGLRGGVYFSRGCVSRAELRILNKKFGINHAHVRRTSKLLAG